MQGFTTCSCSPWHLALPFANKRPIATMTLLGPAWYHWSLESILCSLPLSFHPWLQLFQNVQLLQFWHLICKSSHSKELIRIARFLQERLCAGIVGSLVCVWSCSEFQQKDPLQVHLHFSSSNLTMSCFEPRF